MRARFGTSRTRDPDSGGLFLTKKSVRGKLLFSEHNFFVEESLTKAEQKEVEDSFFSKENDSNRERVRLVYLELEKLGIESFLFDQTFLAAYPLHDGEFDDLGYVDRLSNGFYPSGGP